MLITLLQGLVEILISEIIIDKVAEIPVGHFLWCGFVEIIKDLYLVCKFEFVQQDSPIAL